MIISVTFFIVMYCCTCLVGCTCILSRWRFIWGEDWSW